MTLDTERPLEVLLEFLKAHRGFDFTGYKRSSLERRIDKRMQEVAIEGHLEYMDYLELHPEEFAVLFNMILINVTAFFRDPDSWEQMRTEVIPRMLAERSPDAPFRVWIAGCASGEEAYTVAIVLAEILGEDEYRRRVKIYATDVDEEALEQARAAIYLAKQIEAVPEALRERYFERGDQRYQFRPDLRRTVIFGRNDLVSDAPISRVDLLVCRNTLMYFNAETQSEILRRFHFALQDDGVLMLGKSEMLLTHGDIFAPVDMRRRIFSRVDRPEPRGRLRGAAQRAKTPQFEAQAGALRAEAFDQGFGAQVIVDADGLVASANAEARSLFTLPDADIGRPVQDLDLSFRPVELRGHLERVASDRQPLRLAEVHTERPGGGDRVFDIRLAPLGTDEHLGVTITFLDVTSQHDLRRQLERSKHELEEAYEELQSTVEELETTNEELQSTNEELETTNEELQSTNEELETMNEELQSTNEELETMNDELRMRSVELDEVNIFLEGILTSIGMAIAVLDRQGVVRLWNVHAHELWGLKADEAEGQTFLELDFGLPVAKLKQPLR
jgi:two-component system CheB/CheR fusion protein